MNVSKAMIVAFVAGLILIGLFAARPARADVDGQEKWKCETQILTRAVFTAQTGIDNGTALHKINGYSVRLCADSGQTLSGAGTLNAYKVYERDSLVSRNPGRDLAVSVTATSCQGAACRCQNWDDVPVAESGGGFVAFATSGVTVSGGTTVSVCLRSWNKRP